MWMIFWTLVGFILSHNMMVCCNYIKHKKYWLDQVYNKGNKQYMYVMKILLIDINIVVHNKNHHLLIKILIDILYMDITQLNIHYKWFFSICNKLFHKGLFCHNHLHIINSRRHVGWDSCRLSSLHKGRWRVWIHQCIVCIYLLRLLCS